MAVKIRFDPDKALFSSPPGVSDDSVFVDVVVDVFASEEVVLLEDDDDDVKVVEVVDDVVDVEAGDGVTFVTEIVVDLFSGSFFSDESHLLLRHLCISCFVLLVLQLAEVLR